MNDTQQQYRPYGEILRYPVTRAVMRVLLGSGEPLTAGQIAERITYERKTVTNVLNAASAPGGAGPLVHVTGTRRPARLGRSANLWEIAPGMREHAERIAVEPPDSPERRRRKAFIATMLSRLIAAPRGMTARDLADGTAYTHTQTATLMRNLARKGAGEVVYARAITRSTRLGPAANVWAVRPDARAAATALIRAGQGRA